MKVTKSGTEYYWPEERVDNIDWRHGDLREVSYLYVFKLFDEFVIKQEAGK